jgi:hypothetical protein
VYSSSFSRIDIAETGQLNLIACNGSLLIAYGDMTIIGGSFEEISAQMNSVGSVEDCQIGALRVYQESDWTVANCSFNRVDASLSYGHTILFQECNGDFIGLIGYGQTELHGCVIREIRTYDYIYIITIDCVIDIWYNAYTDYPTATAINCILGTITATAHTTLTLANCEITYFDARDYGSVTAENCTFDQFTASNWAQVTLRGDFAWTQWISVTNDAVVFRVFEIHTIYANGTSCPLVDYYVLTATNLTLYSGTTTSQGTDQFTLTFSQSNIAEFGDQYVVSVDTTLITGWQLFNVSSNQPMQIFVEDKSSLPLSCAHSLTEDPDTWQITNSAESERQSLSGDKYLTLVIKESSVLVTLGFLAISAACVLALINMQYPPRFRIIFSRRSDYEKT